MLSAVTDSQPAAADRLRALIADGSAASRRRIRSILTSRPGVRVVAECTDGFEAADAIACLRPDVVFLDVFLPRLGGFAVCARLGELRPHIVFVSAASEHAARAYARRRVHRWLAGRRRATS